MDTDAVFFLLPLLLPVMVIGFALMMLKLRDGKIDAAALTKLKWILAAFAAVMAWFCLFEDKQTILECRKETMTCTYYRSTIAVPELRPARSFVIKDVRNIELQTEKRRSGKYSTETVYRIVFVTPTAQEEFPTTFDIKEWAMEEIGKINRFLNSDRNVYLYSKGSLGINGFERGLVFSCILSAGILVFWSFSDWKRKKTKEL